MIKGYMTTFKYLQIGDKFKIEDVGEILVKKDPLYLGPNSKINCYFENGKPADWLYGSQPVSRITVVPDFIRVRNSLELELDDDTTAKISQDSITIYSGNYYTTISFDELDKLRQELNN